MISITVNEISHPPSDSVQRKNGEQLCWNPTSDDVNHNFEMYSFVKTASNKISQKFEKYSKFSNSI